MLNRLGVESQEMLVLPTCAPLYPYYGQRSNEGLTRDDEIRNQERPYEDSPFGSAKDSQGTDRHAEEGVVISFLGDRAIVQLRSGIDRATDEGIVRQSI
jgi:hypothetical protein